MPPLDDIREVLIGEEEIAQKVLELGRAISRDYAGREILLVGVLRGAAVFLSDLMRQIEVPVQVDFVGFKSYGDGTESCGTCLAKDLDEPVAGRHVLVVEDIVDKGATLKHLLCELSRRGPASLKVVALLDKPSRREVEVPVDYLGFEVPDEWVVGYGLDYAQRYRNLPFVGVLRPEVYGRNQKG